MKFFPDMIDLRQRSRICLLVLPFALMTFGSRVANGANSSANASAYALVEKGNTAYQAGRYDEALKHYNEASVANPESAELYFNQGTVHYQKGDYEAATKAFADAAVRGKEPTLEANARYNQGNCSFREAERQRDSDLNKAIEACREAIGHYQGALQLDPTMTRAAENIEIVRLYVKALLDEQQKNEEEQQQQDDLGKKLKELLERQIEEIKGSETLGKAQPTVAVKAPPQPAIEIDEDPLASTEPQLGDSAVSESDQSGSFENGDSAPTPPAASPATEEWVKSVAEHAENQKTLQTDTGAVLEGMRQMEAQMEQAAAQPPQPGQPAPAQPSPDQNEMAQKLGEAIGHVGESVNAQGAAMQHFSEVIPATDRGEQKQSAATFGSGQQQQQQSAQHLAEALRALSDPQQDDQQQQENQDGDKQEGDDQEGDDQQDQQKQDQEGKENEDNKEGEEGEKDENEQQQGEDEQKKEDEQQNGKSGEEGDEEKEEQPQSALKPVEDSAEDILNEEKENQKRRVPVRVGGVRPVEKDW